MRAQVSAIGTLYVSGVLFGGLAMQLRVDTLRQLTRNALHGSDVVDGSRRETPHAAEAREQLLPALGPDAFHALELRGVARLRPAGAHAGDREAMRRVADRRRQHQRLRFAAEHERGPVVGKHELLEADLALLA